MSSRRSPQGWWTSRAMARQALQLVPPAPRLIGPQPHYPLSAPRLLPKPTVRPVQTVAPKSRMEKFTGIEKQMLEKTTHILRKRTSAFGYMQKLVKRGYFKSAATANKREFWFTLTPPGERARAGMSLLKSIEAKRALTSYNSMQTATA